MMLIIDCGNEFQIDIQYNSFFKRNVAAIKSLPVYRWNYQTKRWWVPGDLRDRVMQLQYTHKAEVIEQKALTPELTGEIAPLPELTVDLPLKMDLRPYQRQGVARGIELKRFLNGDDMGLGKTFQSIATVVGLNASPGLVICPSSAKIGWQREIGKFSNLKPMILDDRVKNTWLQYYKVGLVNVFITNYDSLKKYFVQSMPKKVEHSKEIIMKEELINLFKFVIVDESQRCKNKDAIRTKLVMQICWHKEIVIELSGTPIENKVKDLWPQICIMNQQAHFGGTEREFLNRYCEGGNGANNLRELNFLLNKYCYFRREKKDVAKELPEKQRKIIVCEITNRAEYMKAVNDFVKYLRDNGCSNREVAKKLRGQIMVKMGVLKQISARGKLLAVKEYVEEILDAGEKVILGCNLHEIVDAIKKMFPHAVTITGKDNDQQKQRSMDAFQRCKRCGINLENHTQADHDHVPSDTNILIANIAAAGVAITLTAATNVGVIEFPWTASKCSQFEDRAYRIGQKNNVTASYFHGQDTIDERLFEIIMEKKNISNAVTGGSDEMEMETINKVLDLFNI